MRPIHLVFSFLVLAASILGACGPTVTTGPGCATGYPVCDTTVPVPPMRPAWIDYHLTQGDMNPIVLYRIVMNDEAYRMCFGCWDLHPAWRRPYFSNYYLGYSKFRTVSPQDRVIVVNQNTTVINENKTLIDKTVAADPKDLQSKPIPTSAPAPKPVATTAPAPGKPTAPQAPVATVAPPPAKPAPTVAPPPPAKPVATVAPATKPKP